MAIVGPNGTGKSTLLRCINGLLPCQKGRIYLDGHPINRMRGKRIARYLGYVPQNGSNLFPFSVLDMVLLGRYPHRGNDRAGEDIKIAMESLRMLGIEELAMRSLDQISGGQRQKVDIARAIAQEARVLLLDEPTSNLDIMHQLEVMGLLRRLVRDNSMSVVVSVHDLNLASRYADTVVLLNQGRIVAMGDPEWVLSAENIARVYRMKVEVKKLGHGLHIIPIAPLSN